MKLIAYTETKDRPYRVVLQDRGTCFMVWNQNNPDHKKPTLCLGACFNSGPEAIRAFEERAAIEGLDIIFDTGELSNN